MRVLFVLPALTEATGPFFRPIKYALFPPLGMAQLAAFLGADDEAMIIDEHVMPGVLTNYEDGLGILSKRWRGTLAERPDMVVIQAYITNAHRAYAIARYYKALGVRVCLGGLHVTSLPEEASGLCDHLFIGVGDASWPAFLDDLRNGGAKPLYDSKDFLRTLKRLPPTRRDLISRQLYLVPNSIVVSRGCPHRCTFCYNSGFYKGGRRFYTQAVDDALAEIERLPGKHLYFLDDHLLGDPHFARALFDGMKGMGRVFQGAATIDSILRGDLVERAVDAGLRSIFIGFESVNEASLVQSRKTQNLKSDADAAIKRLDSLGVMVNGSFVFGLDGDGPDVFDRTVAWAVDRGITTATFHVATPYPGTAYWDEINGQGRIIHRDWRLYDTRHAVFEPMHMSPAQLEAGYWRAYERFYSWANIARAATNHERVLSRCKHFGYSAAWRKLGPAWDLAIRAKRLNVTRPVIEAGLGVLGRQKKIEPSPRATSVSLPVLER